MPDPIDENSLFRSAKFINHAVIYNSLFEETLQVSRQGLWNILVKVLSQLVTLVNDSLADSLSQYFWTALNTKFSEGGGFEPPMTLPP